MRVSSYRFRDCGSLEKVKGLPFRGSGLQGRDPDQ